MGAWGHRFRSMCAIGLCILAAATVVAGFTAPPAHAYNELYCRFVGSTARVYFLSNTAPITHLGTAANDWETGTTGIELVETTHADTRHVYARNIDMGISGYSGILHNLGNLVEDPPCVSGHWDYDKITASVNNHYNASSIQRRDGVARHEFGHFLGLAHNSATTPCLGGGSEKISLMFPNDARFDGLCPVFQPTLDDRNGINALY